MGHTHEFDCAVCGAHFDSDRDLRRHNEQRHTDNHNPPFTKSGDKFAAPKFGSAGSGGAEYEPGPERD